MTRRHTFRLLALLLTPLLVVAVACGDDDTATELDEGAGTPTITVEGAWARTSPMMATNGAIYMELTAVDHTDRLVSASISDSIAAVAEVHETVMDPDTQEMAMRETPAIDLPAGETVTLEPGGYHVMLLDLTEPLEPGTTIEVTLEFEVAGEVLVEAMVRDSAMHSGG
jgi:periplasmic copper chaperone A